MKMSESWAVGGTGIRPGEDVDNSKYYAEKAEQGAANAGWISFKINLQGHLEMMKRGADDIDFKLQNGHLIVTMAD